jgi:uncharacterized protein (UPF0332 family)
MISGRDFLALAQTWIKRTTEAEWRSAVSRAYYAAFHVARQFMEDLGFLVPRGDQAHAYLWLRLSNSGDVQLQIAGSDLSILRRDRNRSDYEVKVTVLHANALLQVQAAARIIKIIEGANQAPTRAQITDTIKDYERNILKVVTWRP